MKKIKYVCKVCGKPYESYKETSYCCSIPCRRKYNNYDVVCETCGKPFSVYKSRYEKVMSGELGGFYCSKACFDVAQTKRVKKICEYCGKEYEIGNCFKDIQKYCSRECYEKYRYEHAKSYQRKICPYCNEEFITTRSKQIFCSNECKFKYTRTEDSEISRYIRKNNHGWRNKVIDKKDYKCELTGRTDNLIVHHVRSFNLVLDEVLKEFNIKADDNMSNYDDAFLKQVLYRFREIQNKYPVVLIHEDIHKLFHHEYGYGYNTEEQWNEFVERHKNEFKKIA